MIDWTEVVVAILLIIVVLCGIALVVMCVMGNVEKEVTVYAIDNRVVTIEDEDGNLFDFFKGSEEYKIGEKLIVKFDTHLTKTAIDDEILKVEKIEEAN